MRVSTYSADYGTTTIRPRLHYLGIMLTSKNILK